MIVLVVMAGYSMLTHQTSKATKAPPPLVTLAIPEGGSTASGTGWTMQVGPLFEPYDLPVSDRAWTTDGGTAEDPNHVAVAIHAPEPMISMHMYLNMSQRSMADNATVLKIISSEVLTLDGAEVGRVEYTGLSSITGAELHYLAYAYMIGEEFVVAAYVATEDSYELDVPAVEPFLQTLRATTP